MVNKCILIGNLGRDPEMRSTSTGNSVVNFSIATSRRWKGADGEKHEETEWHPLVIWGKLADICAQILHKGDRVYVEGRLQTRSWEDRTSGEKKYRTEIVCHEMKKLNSSGERREAAEPTHSDQQADGYQDDADLPF